MAALKNAAGTSIAFEVMEVIKGYDPLKVENRLLDGSFHFQVIGTPPSLLSVTVLSTTPDKDLICQYEAMCSDVKVEFDGKYYVGKIRAKPLCRLSVRGSKLNRLHECSFELVVVSEGDL